MTGAERPNRQFEDRISIARIAPALELIAGVRIQQNYFAVCNRVPSRYRSRTTYPDTTPCRSSPAMHCLHPCTDPVRINHQGFTLPTDCVAASFIPDVAGILPVLSWPGIGSLLGTP